MLLLLFPYSPMFCRHSLNCAFIDLEPGRDAQSLHLLDSQQHERGDCMGYGGRTDGKGHQLDSNWGLSYTVCGLDLWVTEVYAFKMDRTKIKTDLLCISYSCKILIKLLNVDMIC